MLDDQSTRPGFYSLNGHAVYGVPSADHFTARALTRRDLRACRPSQSWLAWALLTLRLRLRGEL